MHLRSRLLLLLVSIVVLSAMLPAHGAALAQSRERCFAETGFCISGRIRTFWERNGGLPVFGFPIGPQQAIVGEDGRERQAQWFERHRLELHPELPAPYDVQLGRVGVERLAQQGRDWQELPPLDPNNADAESCRFFRETNHQVCGAFLTAFRSFGLSFAGVPGVTDAESLALFGLPISEAGTEVIDGKEYTVQWFERARFELHPENRPPFNVLFGRLGAELGGGVGGGAPGSALRGKVWQLESFGPTDAPTLATALGRPATLSFDGTRLGGSTGCNNFSGGYTATADVLTVGPLATTLAACPGEELNRQERAILTALQGEVPYRVAGGTLRLSYDGGRQALTYRAQPPLIGTDWQLESYGEVDARIPAVQEGRPATLRLGSERMAGSTGCNNFSGGYTLSGDTITAGPLATTRALCPGEALSRQEQAILAAFSGPVRSSIAGDRLTLSYDGGRRSLVYRAVAASTATVTGTVTYLQRSALPPQAVIEVKLVDISRADAPSRVIAEMRFEAAGRQAPFPYELRYDPAQIEERNTYAVQARITIDGKLTFISDTVIPVITRGNPTSDVEVLVRPV